MTTAAQHNSILESQTSTAKREHRSRFFVIMAAAIAVTVFIGFAPSYYLRSFFGSHRQLSLLVHLHGFAFTVWTILFAVQTSLVATYRTRVHKRLGIAGAVIGIAAIVIGLAALFTSRGEAWRAWFVVHPSVVATVANVMADNSGNIIIFAVFFAAALYRRREVEAHKRLMLLACFALLNAPVARIIDKLEPWITPATIGTLFNYGLANVMALPFYAALVAYDLRTLRTLHRTTIWGGALLFFLQPLCVMIVKHSDAARALRQVAGDLGLTLLSVIKAHR